jgi:ribokinase
MEASLAAARIAHEAGVKVVLNPAPAAELSDSFLSMVSVIVPNEIEFEGLTGTTPHDLTVTAEASRHLMVNGPSTVVVTIGSRGAYVVEAGNAVHVPTEKVDKVIDTTGAGDAFCGALAFGIASGKTIVDAVTYANKAAGIAVTRLGAIPSLPNADEIR